MPADSVQILKQNGAPLWSTLSWAWHWQTHSNFIGQKQRYEIFFLIGMKQAWPIIRALVLSAVMFFRGYQHLGAIDECVCQ